MIANARRSCKHDCGVENILSGRAKMDVARGLVARDSAQLLHNRDDGIADAARAIGDIVETQVLDPSRACDRVSHGRWH